MKLYKMTIAVRLFEPMANPSAPQNITGYYRSYRVNAKSVDEAKETVIEDVRDGFIDWDDSEVQEEGDDDGKRGIVFVSGRVLYPNE